MGQMCLLVAHLLHCRSSLCLHPVSRLLLLCFYIASLSLWRCLWRGCRWEVFAPSSLCVWSQRPWRSRQMILLPQGFLHIHLRQIVKICEVVDQFIWKLFWFSLSIFSILGSMQLRSRALYILAAMGVRVILR